jgi:hypothetical protein
MSIKASSLGKNKVIHEQDIVNYELDHIHLVLAEMTHIIIIIIIGSTALGGP